MTSQPINPQIAEIQSQYNESRSNIRASQRIARQNGGASLSQSVGLVNLSIRYEKKLLTQLRRTLTSGQFVISVLDDIAEICAEYIRSQWSGFYPPASDPGDPPAIRTSNLDEAIETEIVDMNHARVVIYETDAEYAIYLEYGTMNMEARPFMLPAAEWMQANLQTLASKIKAKLSI